MGLKKFDKRPKKEQFFVLVMLCICMFSFMCITDNKGDRCKDCGIGHYDEGGVKANGCSVLGIGGLITPRRGCGAPSDFFHILYINSYKCSNGKWEQDLGTRDEQKGSIAAWGEDWYGSCYRGGLYDCTPRNDCYAGYIDYEDSYESINGCICSKSVNLDSEEENIINEYGCGCYNGCGPQCINTDGRFEEKIHEMNELEGIE